MAEIVLIRHSWPEKAGFVIDRPNGHHDYIFLHFFSSVTLLCKGEMVKLPPHSCIIYSAGTPQYYQSDHQLIHDWIHFVGDDAEQLLSRCGLEADKIYHPSVYSFITEITRECESEFFTDKANRNTLMSHKLEELFIKLSRSCSGEMSAIVDTTTAENLRRVRGEIFSSLNRPWTITEMARSVGISESRFYAVYKQIYGTSPMEDLINARIESAMSALVSGDTPIGEISDNLGYNNHTHFIRQFKARTGMSPSAYRKKYTSNQGISDA